MANCSLTMKQTIQILEIANAFFADGNYVRIINETPDGYLELENAIGKNLFLHRSILP